MTAWKSHAALRALLHAAVCCRRTLDKANVPQSQVARACLWGNKRNVQHSLSHDLSHQHLSSLKLRAAQRCFSLRFLRSEPDVWWEENNTTRYKLKLRKEGSEPWFYRFSWLHLLISWHTKWHKHILHAVMQAAEGSDRQAGCGPNWTYRSHD